MHCFGQSVLGYVLGDIFHKLIWSPWLPPKPHRLFSIEKKFSSVFFLSHRRLSVSRGGTAKFCCSHERIKKNFLRLQTNAIKPVPATVRTRSVTISNYRLAMAQVGRHTKLGFVSALENWFCADIQENEISACIRVTRVDEFSPIGQLFTLGVDQILWLLVFHGARYICINFDKKCIGLHFWAIFHNSHLVTLTNLWTVTEWAHFSSIAEFSDCG
jgi:hypothetical protein